MMKLRSEEQGHSAGDGEVVKAEVKKNYTITGN